ncbi:MAG TPA: hypothetical protein VI643_00860, partial [Planctomycetota bacterium]|nr:hypothetical protein [Planctomycetota bacterium]
FELRIAVAEAEKRTEEVLRLREQMLALAPTPVIRRRHLQQLAVGLMEAGDLVRGERAIRSLVEGFPEYPLTWFAYARYLQKQGKTQEALVASNKAIAMGNLPEAIALSEELLNALNE